AAEADDIRCEVGGPLRQAGFRLPADRGCLPLPGGREVDLSLYARGGRQDSSSLLDDGMPALPAQGAMHTWSAAMHHVRGARTLARNCAAASRCEPAGDARAPRDCRASIRPLKMWMGATHFLMKRLPKVATEIALHVLAYNLTRVMNIIGIKPLLA